MDNDIHMDSLQEAATRIELAARASFPNRTVQYDNVSVLLIYWACEIDTNLSPPAILGVKTEVDRLERVFKTNYNFEVLPQYVILDTDSRTAQEDLEGKIYEFKKGRSSNDLLIVYYAGHGCMDGETHTRWYSSNNPQGPYVQWSKIQPLLDTSAANVLLLLDCCDAASAIYGSREQGITEIIAACGAEDFAPGVGDSSFTTALIKELESLHSTGQRFTASYLHQLLMQRILKNRKGEIKTPHHGFTTQRDGRYSIQLGSLPGPFDPTSQPSTSVSSSSSHPWESGSDASDVASSMSSLLESLIDQENSSYALVLVQLDGEQLLDEDHWENWLKNVPGLVQKVMLRAIQGVWRGRSAVALLSLPVAIWDMLRDDPAWNFLAFVKGDNKLMSPKMTDWISSRHRSLVQDLAIPKLRTALSRKKVNKTTKTPPQDSPGDVASESINHITDLGHSDWDILFEMHGILRAWRGGHSGSGLPIHRAPKAALALKSGEPKFVVSDDSFAEACESSTPIERDMALKGFREPGKHAAIVGGANRFTLGMGGNISRRDDELDSMASMAIHGFYNFPRVIIYLDPGTLKLSDACVEFMNKHKNKEDIEEVLTEFFQLFGGMLATTVVLGGRLCTIQEIKSDQQSTMIEKKKNIISQLIAAVTSGDGGVNMGGTLSQGPKSTDRGNLSDNAKHMLIETQGGNSLLASNIPDWIASVRSHKLWCIIQQSELRELLTFLEEVSKTNQNDDESHRCYMTIRNLKEYIKMNHNQGLLEDDMSSPSHHWAGVIMRGPHVRIANILRLVDPHSEKRFLIRLRSDNITKTDGKYIQDALLGGSSVIFIVDRAATALPQELVLAWDRFVDNPSQDYSNAGNFISFSPEAYLKSQTLGKLTIIIPSEYHLTCRSHCYMIVDQYISAYGGYANNEPNCRIMGFNRKNLDMKMLYLLHHLDGNVRPPDRGRKISIEDGQILTWGEVRLLLLQIRQYPNPVRLALCELEHRLDNEKVDAIAEAVELLASEGLPWGDRDSIGGKPIQQTIYHLLWACHSMNMEKGHIFRGQRDSKWRQDSSLLRGENDKPPTLDVVVKRMCRTKEFLNRLSSFPHGQLDDRKQLAIAQHYGLPTPLLDYTSSLDVAAWFATGAGSYKNHSHGAIGVIYVVEPDEDFNPKAIEGAINLVEACGLQIGRVSKIKLPEQGECSVDRISNQRGIFIEGFDSVVLQRLSTKVMYFWQTPNESFEDPQGGIDPTHLWGTNDELKKVADGCNDIDLRNVDLSALPKPLAKVALFGEDVFGSLGLRLYENLNEAQRFLNELKYSENVVGAESANAIQDVVKRHFAEARIAARTSGAAISRLVQSISLPRIESQGQSQIQREATSMPAGIESTIAELADLVNIDPTKLMRMVTPFRPSKPDVSRNDILCGMLAEARSTQAKENLVRAVVMFLVGMENMRTARGDDAYWCFRRGYLETTAGVFFLALNDDGTVYRPPI